MSYVQNNLLPGENVVHSARIHWAIYIRPVFVTCIAIFFFCVSGSTADETWKGIWIAAGIFSLLVAALRWFQAYIVVRTSEYAVTNKRLILKVGLIRRRTVETLLGKVESLQVDQSIPGRIFGYGSLQVGGTGGTRESFPYCAKPMELRKNLYMQVESARAPAA